MNRHLAAVLLSIAALTLPALAANPPAEELFCFPPLASEASAPSLEAPAPLLLAGSCGTCGRILSCRGVQIGAACTGITGTPGFCEPTGKICHGTNKPECACF